MKAMTKQQIAAYAGVSVRTLNRWLEPYTEELLLLGWKPRSVLLPPSAIRFVAEKFCIDLP